MTFQLNHISFFSFIHKLFFEIFVAVLNAKWKVDTATNASANRAAVTAIRIIVSFIHFLALAAERCSKTLIPPQEPEENQCHNVETVNEKIKSRNLLIKIKLDLKE